MQNEKTQGPGAFLTAEDVGQLMTAQKRPIIGGTRTYGEEYDNFFGDRRWLPVEEKIAKEPTIDGLGYLAFVPGEDYVGQAQGIGQGPFCPFAKKTNMAGLGAAMKQLAAKVGPAKAAKTLAKLVRARQKLGAMYGLGAEQAFDLVAAVKDISATASAAKPFIEFASNHPVALVSALMLAIWGGAAIGGFTGAGGVEAVRGRK